MKRNPNNLHKNLNFVKISFALFLVLLLTALPFSLNKILDLKSSLDDRSNADTIITSNSPVQSWVVSPNGGEIENGNTEIQFYAKSASNPGEKFSFQVNLVKSNKLFKNLFSIPSSTTLSDREGIRSKFVDFAGVPEGTDYKIELITTSESGANIIKDYSDNFFTISTNTAKPVFTSYPGNLNLLGGQRFEYEIKATDSSNFKFLVPVLPSWLTYSESQKKISGSTQVEGIYSVVIVAVDDLGRQNTQVFSINVKNVSTTSTPIITTTPGSNQTVESQITITLPSGDTLTKSNSQIESKMPANIKANLKSVVVELSKDGNSWQKIYEGLDTKFDLDISKYEGGKYHLRFTYIFKDGTRVVKNYGPINVIKQSDDPTVLTVIIKDLTPKDGEKTLERKPKISATFEKPAGANVDVKKFRFELNGKDLTNDPNARPSTLSFTYAPDSDLAYGTYKVKVTIGVENAESTTKEWSFNVVDKIDAASPENTNILTRNRIILGVVIGIIILIFILSIWAITLSKRENRYVNEYDDTETSGESPLRNSDN